MPSFRSSDYGCVENYPTLLLQLPMRIRSYHFIYPSSYVRNLLSSPLYDCDVNHHFILIEYDTVSSSLVADFVSWSVLAFSLAECSH
jgi:hypothetical protein